MGGAGLPPVPRGFAGGSSFGDRSSHPGGNPISRSTNRGHKTGRGVSGSEPAFPALQIAGARRVLHARMASVKLVPACMVPVAVVCRALSALSVTTAVGQRLAIECRLGKPFVA